MLQCLLLFKEWGKERQRKREREGGGEGWMGWERVGERERYRDSEMNREGEVRYSMVF